MNTSTSIQKGLFDNVQLPLYAKYRDPGSDSDVYVQCVSLGKDFYFLMLRTIEEDHTHNISGTVKFEGGRVLVNGKEGGRFLENCLESDYGYDDFKFIFSSVDR